MNIIYNQVFKTNYQNCTLCPRECKVDRTVGQTGYCGETDKLKIASIGAHFGEEPPISGTNGSGTVFLTGCSLKCCYCQNYQISFEGLGNSYTSEQVVLEFKKLVRSYNIHNVNFVTPDHFFPHTIEIVELLREQNISLPILYNMSGYQKVESVKSLVEYADIYMPDFKYADKQLAKELSNAEDYPERALESLIEMVRQKGFLDSFTEEKLIATKGVLVRHLILPDHMQNSKDILSTLFIEFGKDIPISLMSQYYPSAIILHNEKFSKKSFLHRRITLEEFEEVHEHALSLGFRNMLVQFPQDFKLRKDIDDFVPDFERKKPFKGNR
ncbi:MAG: radical SAM protein [Candidatus Celaenobacter antarcticus]|nr:radical SAM protein [Candidatus Celaenobacter antarcticus]